MQVLGIMKGQQAEVVNKRNPHKALGLKRPLPATQNRKETYYLPRKFTLNCDI